MVIAVNRHYKFHAFLFTLLSFQLFISFPVAFISKFFAIAIFIGVLLHIKKIKFEYTRWQEIAVFFVVSGYLTFAIFGYDLFVTNTLDLHRLLRLSFFVTGFIWTSYVLQSLLDAIAFLDNAKNRLCSPSNDGYWKKWFVLLVIMFVMFMIWQRAFNPIVMSPDSYQYIMNSYLVGRSVLYVFFNNLIMQVAPTSPAVEWIGITQIFAFSCLLSTILMYFHKNWIRFKYIAVMAIILPMIPSFALHTIVIWADLKVGMTILWLTYVTVRIIDEIILNNTANKKQQLSLCVQICIAMVLMYFSKANTAVVYLVTVPVLAIFFILRKQWNFLISIALSVVFILLIRFPGHDALNAVRYPNLDAHKYFAGIHDMQAAYYNRGKFSDKNLALLKKYIPNIDDIRGNFRPDWVMRDDWGNLQGVKENMTTREFVSMYADTFIRNPWQMSRSMLYRNRAYWVISPKKQINCVSYTGIWCRQTRTTTTQAPAIDVYRQHNLLTNLMEQYISIMDRYAPATFIWRFGVWTALMVVSIATLISQKRYIYIY